MQLHSSSRRFMPFLIALLVALLEFGTASAQFALSVEDKANLASVRVGHPSHFASGVMIADNLVLTNLHCVKSRHRIQQYPHNSSVKWLDSTIIAKDAKADLVLLKITPVAKPRHRNLRVASKLPSGSFTVCAVGWPDGKFANHYTTCLGTTHFVYHRDGLNATFLRFSRRSAGGQSGSPVITSNGEIVGMYWGYQGSQGLAAGLPAIHTLLRKAGYSHLIGPANPRIVEAPRPRIAPVPGLKAINRVLKTLGDEMHDMNRGYNPRSVQRQRLIDALRGAMKKLEKISNR